MADPFLSEIKIVGFNFPPRGWAQCDGQILPINQNQSLYSLLGTTYGGDGRTSFALPDLRGRAAVHPGSGSPVSQLGTRVGEETHSLSVEEMPAHNHPFAGYDDDPQESMIEEARPCKTETNAYGPAASLVQMGEHTIQAAGGGAGHDNMQPFLALNFVIALQGVFPSRN